MAAVEHALIIAALRERVELPRPASPTSALKTLLAYGLLSEAEYEQLMQAVKIRNEIVHRGYAGDDPRRWLDTIIPIAEQLAA